MPASQSDPQPRTQTDHTRRIESSALKGLAHPLRMAIYDALAKYGPQTATTLASRLGESSGSTSYHLRQLARHDFIRQVEGSTGGREKWWERIPGAVTVPSRNESRDSAAHAAADFVIREFNRSSARALEDFVIGFTDEGRLSTEWLDAADITTSNVHLTSAQLAEISQRYHDMTQTLIDEFRGRNDPGSRPVQIQFNAFPLIDGEETPS
ncbi:MAG: helix-turn-helix domain-containing protein [Brevibacterium sp.]|uniref:ArsR/SmtB family transcription factor n=1 Tax=Brevibacterium sp. TaxID=1701 RepID=UPI002647D732|nr:helix-turn-helix domain-containing protein [Brevibacterium sp.]MDN5807138.1 helix-turn-helix domain-containing protein [Brevibacterium sp.]MDN5833871.1 helix-turn-helix domain-containing protein [Brevibacterium sp.]MDN5876268.1 helix-turn-helix domain-containing protein [Brevibacterium sp.]MDN5909929.1 helix-turn-helix domain-containing protein [Brevibacterium sp.]MDN6133046.1 helix-turn-helix domain-containing protein [Brevibacterium sp.]